MSNTVNATRLSRMLDVTPRHIRTLTENGVLKKAGPNEYDGPRCIADYIRHIENEKIQGVLSRYSTEDRPRVIELFENSFRRKISNELRRCKTRKEFDSVLLDHFPSYIFENLRKS